MKSSEYIAIKKKEREQTEMPEIEQIVKDLYQGDGREQSEKMSHCIYGNDDCTKCKKETKETQPISHEKQEKIVSATFDWKTIAIFILSIILLGALIGYNLKDRGMQESIDTIQRENKIIWTANKQIDNAKITIAKSESNIEAKKKILKDKYHIIYQ